MRHGPATAGRLRDHETQQRAIDVATIAGHDDGFLAEIAPLGVTDGLRRPAHFHHQAILVDVHAVDRRACLDAQDVVGPQARWTCPCAGQHLPDAGRMTAQADKVISWQSQRIVAANLDRAAVQL